MKVASTNNNDTVYQVIRVKANDVTPNDDGTFDIMLTTQRLSTEEVAMLEHLFPNLTNAAFELLTKEALLAAIVTRR